MQGYETPQDVLSFVMRLRSSPVQLVKHIDEVPESKLAGTKYMQVKLDGVWCGLLVFKGQCIAISRTGNIYTNLEWLTCQSTLLPDGLYIGELWVSKSLLSLEELSGLINCNRKEALEAEQLVKLQSASLAMHDYLTIPEFVNGESPRLYSVRYADLKSAVNLRSDERSTYIIRNYVCESLMEFHAFADECIARGEEGAVLKLEEGWVAGHKGYRVTKRVRGIHVDLVCTGYSIGDKGKRKGQIAKLHFEYKGKEFTADLGRGWSDDKRIALTHKVMEWGDSQVVGKIWHVSGLQESSKGVIRLPKVNEERFDKLEPDQ